ncbi:glutathione S-transferase family protein [Pseudomonas versuta]|uniref:Glutathione S-transferase n=1 Tax=Pseudomonas versuta TaxID=1788301 RepID=A0ABX3E4N6_9PSED|nr:glutathione S-transferase family protein [Pseudomonas versuta]ALE89529.1 glutathione S-transferase [Pseudomonas versuta]OKA18393.1 glutathione S-transferase [Pseudomonas versuta]
MSELILHHYAASPFAQKARLLLGFKGLAWHSVHIPPMMPKPELTALSGGYRKTPVLQAGADIYCDTALIARRLEQEKSAPALFPLGQELVVSAFAAWADSVVFQHAVSLVFQPESAAVRFAKMPPEMLKAFVADRAGLFSGGSATRVPAEQALLQWPVIMARLEQQLQHEQGDYLFGKPSIADFALAHSLWFLKATPVTAPLVDAYPAVSAWLQRVLDFGQGTPIEMTAEQALAVAKGAEPVALPEFDSGFGFSKGQRVTVAATDYGVDPVEGELVYIGAEELVVRREDPRAGVVHVHFPRIGFRIEAVGQ